MAFLRRRKKKKKATSKDLGKADCVFSQSWEKLGVVPQCNLKKKKKGQLTLPLGVMQNSQPPRPRLSRESKSRWHPDFLLSSQALTKPQTGKNTTGLLHTDFSPGLRAAVAAPCVVKVIKDLLPHQKPSTSSTENIPLQKKWILWESGGKNGESKYTVIIKSHCEK